ncbi:MAG TPA: CRISPR-associated protein Cas4 [bacterium]|nr:CRISPR-associated protein Cas4 [bacterium]HPN43933.1 CRISPR-associated protein Cas4 [bacterium]
MNFQEKNTELDILEIRFTGTQVNYYFHCKKELWFFSHNILTDHESDLVLQGRLLHDSSYSREKKEIEIDQIKIDFFDLQDNVLHEVKRSDTFENNHRWQVLFYLFYLKQKGINNISGEINYPLIKKKIEVNLTPEKENEIGNILKDINLINNLSEPPKVSFRKSYCSKCSYYELCFI